MSTSSRHVWLAVWGVFISHAAPCPAAPPTPRERQLITQAMQESFAACNREDVDAVMKACADAMPERERFRQETVATFREKDIHYSLVECEVLDVRLPWAKARIVQDTHVLDRASATADEAEFRNNSALLPRSERVEYINTFKRENGRWKLYVIITEMRPVEKPRDTEKTAVR